MENATDALIMAGQMLVFILALTICMSSFTTLRTNITNLIEQPETIKMTQDSEGYLNYVESQKSSSTRIVGAETVVSSMYRAIKENYVVYIKLNNIKLEKEAIDKDRGTGKWSEKENEKKVDNIVVIQAKNSLNLKDEELIKPGDWLVKVTIGREEEGINQRINSLLGEKGLFDYIKDKKFNEYLGEYQDGTKVSTENKLTKRIITYIEK